MAVKKYIGLARAEMAPCIPSGQFTLSPMLERGGDGDNGAAVTCPASVRQRF